MAHTDYFLKIDGIEGESADSKHPKTIEIESWSLGATNSGTAAQGTGMGAGKVSMQDVHFTMKMNKASPLLFLFCASGKHVASGKIFCRKPTGDSQEDYLVVEMTDLMISSYQSGGHSGSGIIPTDQFSINFSKVEMKYKPQDEKGKLGVEVTGGWDVKANKKV